MARIVVVHGIGQQNEGGLTLHDRLFPALGDGVTLAGGAIQPKDVAFASYGHFFRPRQKYFSRAVLR